MWRIFVFALERHTKSLIKKIISEDARTEKERYGESKFTLDLFHIPWFFINAILFKIK